MFTSHSGFMGIAQTGVSARARQHIYICCKGPVRAPQPIYIRYKDPVRVIFMLLSQHATNNNASKYAQE